MSQRLITGSQVLATCLFGLGYDNVLTKDFSDSSNASDMDSTQYMAFKPELVFTYTDRNNKNHYNTISDAFPAGRAKAFCYFLARKGGIYTNSPRQFLHVDNGIYMATQINQARLQSWVTTKTTTREVFNNGKYILMAPGLNRTYLNGPTGEDELDDIINDHQTKQ